MTYVDAKPVIISYQKPFRRYKTAYNYPQTEIAGNVIIMINSEIIQEFSIPVADIQFDFHCSIKTFQRNLPGRSVQVAAHKRYTKGVIRDRKVARLFIANSLSPIQLKPKSYGIPFPNFFNRWMIHQALGTLLKNAPKRKNILFAIDPSKKLEHLSIDTPEVQSPWGGAWLVERLGKSKNTSERGRGDPVWIHPIEVNPRKRLS